MSVDPFENLEFISKLSPEELDEEFSRVFTKLGFTSEEVTKLLDQINTMSDEQLENVISKIYDIR